MSDQTLDEIALILIHALPEDGHKMDARILDRLVEKAYDEVKIRVEQRRRIKRVERGRRILPSCGNYATHSTPHASGPSKMPVGITETCTRCGVQIRNKGEGQISYSVGKK